MKTRYSEVDTPALFLTGWYDNLVHEGVQVLPRLVDAGALGGDARLTKLHRRSLAAQPLRHGERHSDRRRLRRRRRGRRAGHPPPLVRPAPEGHRQRDRRRAAAPALRDGRQRLARRAGVAARPHPLHRLLPPQRRPRQLAASATARSAPTPPGDEPPDTFTYDPEHPVPTVGGQSMFTREQRPAATAAPSNAATTCSSTPRRRSKQDIEVTGPIAPHALRRDRRPRHRLHRHAGRRSPPRRGDQSLRRHHPRPLSRIAGDADA